MSLLVATVLVGRRGAWLGALGGLGSGAVIGVFTFPSLGVAGIVASTVVGLLLGIVLGFAPIFRGLKINERYICAGLRSRATSSSRADEGSRSYESSHGMNGSPVSSRRQRAVPKLTHGTQRYGHMGHTSENEGSTRRNTEEPINGSEEAGP
ncbi:transmembrane domain-containing protein, putative [Eimeria mitis]|uniref:Transmembrane domain-containing protein, putative n=1 Tax=Eimeria mitis TaxID=44415 RepID=U6KF20_9EIME|nr:transmembrane domain-containing protein, putative [Eimeria mitis]CDJ36635.1 transmembrane domain-containing protein, putative [Eimeria mitis]